MQATACTSVVHVDSAVRWRRNGAGGLIRNSCLRTVVRPPFFVVLRFHNSQCCASRSLTARRLATSVVAGLATPQAAFALFRKSVRCKFASSASVGAVLFSCRSPRGEFCEPPQGGASARTAERRYLALQAATAPNIFSFTFPRCRQLLIPVCRGAGNNSQFKIHNAQLRSSLSF